MYNNNYYDFTKLYSKIMTKNKVSPKKPIFGHLGPFLANFIPLLTPKMTFFTL